MDFLYKISTGLLLLLTLFGSATADYRVTERRVIEPPAVQKSDSVRIFFRQSKIDFVPDLRENQKNLDRITDSLRNTYSDSLMKLRRVEVVGGASPEGSIKFNNWLSEERAKTLFNYLSKYTELPDSIRVTRFLGRDWRGLIRLVEHDYDVPYREETLVVLNRIADEVDRGINKNVEHLRSIKKLRAGVPYKYMYEKLFPILRASQINLWYEKVINPIMIAPEEILTIIPEEELPKETLEEFIAEEMKLCRPFYMGVKTNMLYDILAIPNIGVEFYLGKNLTLGANWMYAWWNSDRRHRYWRTYGGDIHLKYWFGSKAHEKPMTGHHLGIYAQALTYDFEWGGKGYIGGEPGGSLFDRPHWGAGIEYGYSLPIARRWNIDFTLGIGYLGGRQYEYNPDDDHYVWYATRNKHWFGPTKLEVSLVWLLGCDNYNRQKGGDK